MASYLYGLDSGISIDISLGAYTASGDLSDIVEQVRPSNLIIGLTEDQFNLLFDVSAIEGTLVLDASALQNLFTNILNNQNEGTSIGNTWRYLDNELTFSGITFDDIFNGDLIEIQASDLNLYTYNLADYIEYCRLYLEPGSDLDDIRKRFVATSLGIQDFSDASFGELSDTLVTTYSNLGFFDSLAQRLGDISDILGGGDNPALSGDVVIDTTNFDGSKLFAAIADAGFITNDGISDTPLDLSLEDGFAIAVQLVLAGSTNVTVRYPLDISFSDPSSGAVTGYLSDLSGVLAGEDLDASVTKKLSDPEVTNYLATGTLFGTNPGAGSQTINVLLLKYSGTDGLVE
jgi:hypothetical protein